MQLRGLVAAARKGNATVYAFERGKPAAHSFAQLADDVDRVRDTLLAWGVRPGMRVGIYAPNSYAWLVHDLALIECGAISVPFTDDFAGAVDRAALDRYNIALLLTAKKHAKLFPGSPHYVAFIDDDNKDVAVIERPRSDDPDWEDQHSLVFSSGSAGGLKGLVISRKGLETTLPPIMDAIGLGRGERLQMFLPMSNLQQRNMCYSAIWYDCDIIITDYTQLFACMRALNPTILVAPPILFDMVYAEFQKLPPARRTFATALMRLFSFLPRHSRQGLARLLLPDLAGQFGTGMRRLITGMAPIRKEIGGFFERMGLPLCESYGMVEAGSITFRAETSREYGSVGKVLDGINLHFRDDGEILVQRKYPLTLRYFQCADGENERTFVAADTIATGDIGRLDEKGNLFLLGRKKEQIVTPGGLKIHPEIIERELGACEGVKHCVVFLKPGATHLTCVVDLVEGADANTRERVKKFAASLRSTRNAFQHVEVVFATEPFTTQNGALRPNMKVDRKRIAAQYS